MTGQGTQRGPPWCADRSAPDSRPLPRPAQGPRRAILQERRPTSGQKSAQAASFSRIRLGRSAPHRPRDRGEGLALHTKRDQSRRFPRQRSPRISIEIGRQSLHHTFLRVEMFLLRCAANPPSHARCARGVAAPSSCVGRGLQRQTKNGVSDHRRPTRARSRDECHDDDDHADGSHDSDYDVDHRRALRRFESTAIANVTFSDDPAFTPRQRDTFSLVVKDSRGTTQHTVDASRKETSDRLAECAMISTVSRSSYMSPLRNSDLFVFHTLKRSDHIDVRLVASYLRHW
jgi:hypothetical protein